MPRGFTASDYPQTTDTELSFLFSLWLVLCSQSQLGQLQNISGLEEEESQEEETRISPQSQPLKYLCVQELTFPHHGVQAKGVGVAESPLDPSQGNTRVMRTERYWNEVGSEIHKRSSY